jgi:mono/diheme cytochrome c family protein
MKGKFILVVALLAIASAVSSAADEGDALYKTKCAGCHGAGGEGKPAIKAPALKGTSLDVAQLVDHLTKGETTSKPPHNKGIAGLSGDQAKEIAEFVKSLK